MSVIFWINYQLETDVTFKWILISWNADSPAVYFSRKSFGFTCNWLEKQLVTMGQRVIIGRSVNTE